MKGRAKAGSAVRDLGCSVQRLKAHLENQFRQGMTWENYGHGLGRWCIDHHIPLSSVDLTDRKQLLRVCHYRNLRPMWFDENISKGAKV